MKSHVLNQYVLTLAAIVTLIGFNAYSNSAVHTAAETTASVNRPANAAKYRYATLTLTKLIQPGTAIEAEEKISFVSTFDFGIEQYYGKSTVSRDASYRPIINRLGGNSSQIDIHTLMDAIGAKGWKLVETHMQDTEVTRVFIQGE